MKSQRMSYKVNEVFLMAVGEILQPFGSAMEFILFMHRYFHSGSIQHAKIRVLLLL